MKPLLYQAWALAVLVVSTAVCGSAAIVGTLFDPTGETSFRAVRAWARSLLRAGRIRVEVEGRENLRHITGAPNWVYVANHQSALDIPALLDAFPESLRMIAKVELFGIPLFGAAIRRLGFVPVDRKNHAQAVASLDDAEAQLRAGRRMLVFAEGERSHDGRLLPFKKGIFVLAIRTGLPVVPVAISGSAGILPRETLRLRPGTIRIRIGPAIPTAGMSYDDRDRLSSLTRAWLAENVEEHSRHADAAATQPIATSPSLSPARASSPGR